MDGYLPYLVTRSTMLRSRRYGARLYVGNNFDDEDYGSMEFVEDEDLQEDALTLVEKAFGTLAKSNVLGCTSDGTGREPAVYSLEDGRWRDDHERFGSRFSVAFRQPGTHPDLDDWQDDYMESADKVVILDEEDNLWYVMPLDQPNVYLLVPGAIAKGLRKKAEQPAVDITHSW
ncbi:hypothetical protein WJX77_002097 [Trebouxia sp. C0004]